MRNVVRLAFCVAEPHQAAAISASRWQSRTRLDVSQQKYSVSAKAYFFFFLAVFFFAFFAFLAMVPSVVPKLSPMQVEHRRADDSVHHNRKIDTACFEQGKRRTPLRPHDALAMRGCERTALLEKHR
jgi:hypothetical protein